MNAKAASRIETTLLLVAMVLVTEAGLWSMFAQGAFAMEPGRQLLAQARPLGERPGESDPVVQAARLRRDRLRGELDDLLAQQAQLGNRVKQIQADLKLPQVPAAYQEKRCKLLDLLEEQKKLQERIQNVSTQLAQAQQQVTAARSAPPPSSPPPQTPTTTTRSPDPLDRLMALPLNPLSGMPNTFRRRLVGEDAKRLSGNAAFEVDLSSRTLYLSSHGAGATITVRIEFSMSDGTRQFVRLRSFVDSTSGGSAPGLAVTYGPALMDKGTRADSLAIWGPITVSWPPGTSGTGHAILDVPGDDSIMPETFKFQFN